MPDATQVTTASSAASALSDVAAVDEQAAGAAGLSLMNRRGGQ
jgi:hypothetical protein